MKHFLFISLTCLALACAPMPKLIMTEIPERPAFTDENMDSVLCRLIKAEAIQVCQVWPESWGDCASVDENYCDIFSSIPFGEHRLIVDSLFRSVKAKGYTKLDAIVIYRMVSGFNEHFHRQYYLRSNGKWINPGLEHYQTSAGGFDMKEFSSDSLRIDYPVIGKGTIKYFNQMQSGQLAWNTDYIFIWLDSDLRIRACRVVLLL